MHNKFNPASIAMEQKLHDAVTAITKNTRRGKMLKVNLVKELARIQTRTNKITEREGWENDGGEDDEKDE